MAYLRAGVVLVSRLADQIRELAGVDHARIVLAAHDLDRHRAVGDGVVFDPCIVHWRAITCHLAGAFARAASAPRAWRRREAVRAEVRGLPRPSPAEAIR